MSHILLLCILKSVKVEIFVLAGTYPMLPYAKNKTVHCTLLEPRSPATIIPPLTTACGGLDDSVQWADLKIVA